MFAESKQETLRDEREAPGQATRWADIFRMLLHTKPYQLGHCPYVLHAHPQTASSWSVPCTEHVRQSPMVQSVVAHPCAFGRTSNDGLGPGPVKKPTATLLQFCYDSKAAVLAVPGMRGARPALGWCVWWGVTQRRRRRCIRGVCVCVCRAVCVGVTHHTELGAAFQFMSRVGWYVTDVALN